MRVSLQNISKSFGGNTILQDFSLEIPSQARLCLCGFNGSGKSTLLKIIAGKEPCDAGKVVLPKGCRLGYVEQELDAEHLATDLLSFVLSVLPDWQDFWQAWEEAIAAQDEQALLRLSEQQAALEAQYGYNPEHQAKTVLSGLGFAQSKWHMPLAELSGGWRERAKLARVLTQGADVLLLDEPTNHLDIEAVEWLENFLLDYSGTLLFVAHDRVFMDKIGTHILFFHGTGKPMFRKGTFSHFLSLQDEITEQRAREAAKLQDEIDKKMDFVRRFKAKASKARQAVSKQKMAKKLEKELEGLQAEPKRRELDFSWPEPPQSDRTVLSVADLAFRFPDGKELWPPLSFSLYRGQKVALVGPNGAGKSTLLRLVVGRLERAGGSLALGQQVRLAYFSQHQLDTLRPEGTALGEIRRLSDPRTTEEELMSVLGLFQLGQSFFERKVALLSGGERARLMLAVLFLSRSNFLVLDEPTNHLDLESREALVQALYSYSGTVLMVAHDRYLLSQAAQEVWELSPSGMRVFLDGYGAYEQAHKQQQVQQRRQEQEVRRTEVRQTSGLSREEVRQLKRDQAEQRRKLRAAMQPVQARYASLEKQLETLLAQLGELEAQLAAPTLYEDGAQAEQMLKEYHSAQQQAEGIMLELESMEQSLAVFEQQRQALA